MMAGDEVYGDDVTSPCCEPCDNPHWSPGVSPSTGEDRPHPGHVPGTWACSQACFDAASTGEDRLREALDAALVGMVRTSWPMDRNAEEKGWNEAIHAARRKVAAVARAALTPTGDEQ